MSRFTRLNKIRLILYAHFPIDILNGLRTPYDETMSWNKPSNSLRELDIDIRTEGDIPNDYFSVHWNEFRYLEKVKLRLNSKNIPRTLFYKELKSLNIILTPLFKGDEKNTVNFEFIDKSLKELDMTVSYDSFRSYYVTNKNEVPQSFVTLPKSLEKLKNLEELNLHGVVYDESIKKLRKLKNVGITNVPLNSDILSAKPEVELSIRNAYLLSGTPKIKIPINRKTKYLDIRIWTDSEELDLSFYLNLLL